MCQLRLLRVLRLLRLLWRRLPYPCMQKYAPQRAATPTAYLRLKARRDRHPSRCRPDAAHARGALTVVAMSRCRDVVKGAATDRARSATDDETLAVFSPFFCCSCEGGWCCWFGEIRGCEEERYTKTVQTSKRHLVNFFHPPHTYVPTPTIGEAATVSARLLSEREKVQP